MYLNIGGKVALIMASNKGLGYSCAEALAKEGCDVAICSNNKDNLLKTKKQIESISGVKVLSIFPIRKKRMV